MLPKKYALFIGDNYYPRGGWKDFSGYYDERHEAVAAGEAKVNEDRYWNDWYHVVDLTTGDEVANGHKDRSKF
jgi:hypothetical protein